MTDPATPPEPEPPKQRPCPLCGKPRVERYRPFCSKRCADVDLARWLGGTYTIPAAETDEDDIVPPPETRRD